MSYPTTVCSFFFFSRSFFLACLLALAFCLSPFLSSLLPCFLVFHAFLISLICLFLFFVGFSLPSFVASCRRSFYLSSFFVFLVWSFLFNLFVLNSFVYSFFLVSFPTYCVSVHIFVFLDCIMSREIAISPLDSRSVRRMDGRNSQQALLTFDVDAGLVGCFH